MVFRQVLFVDTHILYHCKQGPEKCLLKVHVQDLKLSPWVPLLSGDGMFTIILSNSLISRQNQKIQTNSVICWNNHLSLWERDAKFNEEIMDMKIAWPIQMRPQSFSSSSWFYRTLRCLTVLNLGRFFIFTAKWNIRYHLDTNIRWLESLLKSDKMGFSIMRQLLWNHEKSLITLISL